MGTSRIGATVGATIRAAFDWTGINVAWLDKNQASLDIHARQKSDGCLGRFPAGGTVFYRRLSVLHAGTAGNTHR